jgi:hypothetical protein
MVKAYNTEKDLRERLAFLGNADSWNLTDILGTAHRRVLTVFGREIHERLLPVLEGQTSFRLSFDELISLSQVTLFDKLVDPQYYTVNLEEGLIVFNSNWAGQNLKGHYRLVVEYVPKIYKDMELLYAIEEVLELSTVQTNDQEENVRLEQVKRRINKMSKEINRLMPPPDDQRGQSIPANHRFSFL